MSASKLLYHCPLCQDFQATEFSLLLPHIRLVHSTRPGFTIPCTIDNCTRVFTKMKTFTNHIYGDHLNLLRANHHGNLTNVEMASHDIRTEEQDFEMDEDTNEEGNSEQQQSDDFKFPFEFKSIIATWILRLKETCRLPQSTMEKIIEGVTDLNQYILLQIYEAIKSILSHAKISIDKLPNLEEIFHPNGKYGMPFKDIQSSYQLLDHCKHHFNMVVSLTYLKKKF